MSWVFNPFTGNLDKDSGAGSGGSGNAIVEYRTITASEALLKKLTLSNTPLDITEVQLDIISGTTQEYGIDYDIINTNELNWNGLALDVTLEENDKLRIIYGI